MQELLSENLIHIGTTQIQVGHLLVLLALFLSLRLLLWLVRRIVKKRIDSRKLDAGRSMAVYQIFKYFIVVIGLVIGLDIIGIKVTILLAGSAALLVGVGLGIQQLFNDLVSGIVLLVEGTVTVGDIVELEGVVGQIEVIRLRTSQLQTRDGISIIVPNSKLVSDNVINWSHNRQLTRFSVTVGVAYGSNVPLVKQIIQDAAHAHADVSNETSPIVRMTGFGESSLDFELLFWSKKMWLIEDVKSELRLDIEQKFRDHDVTIPFPQRDIHFKTILESQKIQA